MLPMGTGCHLNLQDFGFIKNTNHGRGLNCSNMVEAETGHTGSP